jgi:hypothetical protein
MKSYVFLTPEGYTQTPKDENIENLQVLGISEGSDEKEALTNLVKENPYLSDSGFEEAIAVELVDGKQFYLSLVDK